ncbi:MAG TPA: class I fructose-bisphosphate aldolase [Actinomycetota bacterium]
MDLEELERTARALVAPGRGILAADESTGTIRKRFDSIGLDSTEENRRAYREMLLTTPGMEQFISGVIMFDETLRQSTADGVAFTKVLEGAGIIPGIKVDLGAKPLAGFPGEQVTEGLDGLRERLAEYRELGARFTKWRAVITIGESIPTQTCIDANAEALARFAALSQEADLVPIVEPETMMDGDHTIDRHYDATRRTLEALFDRLFAHRVELTGTLLKTNMVLSGKSALEQAGVEDVARWTLRVLRECVPPALPGVVFLSGGQTDEAATAHLSEMNRIGGVPWQLSFSYGRALQAPALKAWAGKPGNVAAGQRALHHRARLNSAARTGSYSPDMEDAAA